MDCGNRLQWKTHFLGQYELKDDAIKARLEAEEKYHGADFGIHRKEYNK